MSYIDEVMKEDVPVITYDKLTETGMVEHGFSTRKGGVSEGEFSTMNLSLTRGDNRDKVLRNFKIMADRLNMPYENMVLSSQTHTTNIRVVTKTDKGNGL